MSAPLPRVVLDTNVVVSAFWGGPPREAIRAWFNERYVLLISAPILAEYYEILERLHPGSHAVSGFLHAVYLKGIAVQPKQRMNVVQQDPSDNRFLECALAGKALYLVSGDHHLLRLKNFRQTKIMNPRAFLQVLA